jgi:hypothetical protein
LAQANLTITQMDARIAELLARLTALERDTIVQADQIYIPRHALPPSLIARLIRLAAFQNPEFYATQAMRRSTHDKPRIISCAELTSHHVALPRGCFDAVRDLFASVGIAVTVEDFRVTGAPIPFAFAGVRRPNQEQAVAAPLPACLRRRQRSARRS